MKRRGLKVWMHNKVRAQGVARAQTQIRTRPASSRWSPAVQEGSTRARRCSPVPADGVQRGWPGLTEASAALAHAQWKRWLQGSTTRRSWSMSTTARAARDIGLRLERRPLELGVLLGDAANLHERHRGGGVALEFPVVFSRRIEKQSNALDSVMFLQMARLPDLPPVASVPSALPSWDLRYYLISGTYSETHLSLSLMRIQNNH